MRVRRFCSGDFQAIANIYNEAIADGGSTMDMFAYSGEDIRAIVAKFGDRETILIAEENHRVLGYGMIKRYSDRPGYRVCCETSTYFSLSETGKGYGRILQAELLKQVAELGYHHVVAKICASNQGSIAFHQRFGFEVVGIQKEIGFQNGHWHDVMIMQLILADVPPYQPELKLKACTQKRTV